MKLRVKLQFEPRDCYIGVYWNRVVLGEKPDSSLLRLECGKKPEEQAWLAKELQTLHRDGWKFRDAVLVYVCLLPWLPIRFLFSWGEYTLTRIIEMEYFANCRIATKMYEKQTYEKQKPVDKTD